MPTGIEDYSDAQRYYYVDKTLFIKEIIDRFFGKTLLITRPRLFGKTLLLSMVDYYFNIGRKEKNLFVGKAISSCPSFYLAYQNSLPLVHINMKKARGSNVQELKSKAIEAIRLACRPFLYLLNSPYLLPKDKEEFSAILNGTTKKDYEIEASIQKLTLFLRLHHQQRVAVLIDEYDTPLESAYENGFYNDCIGFFKNLYSATLKGNQDVLFSICTGVLEISKESLFSGLNNLEVCSIAQSDLAEFFGFTEREVKDLLKQYGMEASYDDVRDWYGKYRVGEKEVFNPWSTLNYIKNKTLLPYWANTGSNALVEKLLDEEKKQRLMALLNGPMTVSLNMAVNYQDLKWDPNSVYSFLVQAGYLQAEAKGNGEYGIGVANRETYEVFKNDVIARKVERGSLHIAEELRQAFLAMDTSRIEDIVEKYILASYSYYDLGKEKDYQNMLTGLLAVLFDTHIVRSEVNTRFGRCDILLSPKREHDIGIVIELKHYSSQLSSAKLKQKSLDAITQIRNGEYYRELLSRDCKEILLFGLAFDPKHHHFTGQRM